MTIAWGSPTHSTWWEEAAGKSTKGREKTVQWGVIYTFWNLCKERNRRIFNNTEESAKQVAAKTKDDLEQRKRDFACGG
jgi:hypothetical protein